MPFGLLSTLLDWILEYPLDMTRHTSPVGHDLIVRDDSIGGKIP
jgi:hypothetical protein